MINTMNFNEAEMPLAVYVLNQCDKGTAHTSSLQTVDRVAFKILLKLTLS